MFVLLEMIFEAIGGVGLVLIIVGVLINKRRLENFFYIIGGLYLLSYSIYIKNFIFIALQIVFILAAGYDLVTMKRRVKNKGK